MAPSNKALQQTRHGPNGASLLNAVLGRLEEPVTVPPASMSDIYTQYLAGGLPLATAADLLRQSAQAWKTEPGSLKLDLLPNDEREKAAQLLNESIQPIMVPYMAGDISSESAARQLAPLVLPVGVFALNLGLPSEGVATDRMTRLAELAEKLVQLEEASESE